MDKELINRIILVLERCIGIMGGLRLETYGSFKFNIYTQYTKISSDKHHITLNSDEDQKLYSHFKKYLRSPCFLSVKNNSVMYMDNGNDIITHTLDFIHNIEEDYFSLSTLIDHNILNLGIAVKYLIGKYPDIFSCSFVGVFDDEYIDKLNGALDVYERKRD